MKSITSDEISEGLSQLGLPQGAKVLVHSSLSSFGHVEGGADAVIDAVLNAVAPDGTVLVPTLTATALHSPENPPAFDPVNTPCWTGRIPETFRNRPQAVRSLHPTHSVAAIGAHAEELTKDHTFSISPCDEKSPFGKLSEHEDGFVLLLGAGYGSITNLHHAEELAGVDYHMQKGFTKATLIVDGEEVTRNYMLHQWGTPRDFSILESLFVDRGVQRKTQIGNSDVRLLSAAGIATTTLACLRSDSRILCKD